MAANPALWFLQQTYYSCIINYFETVNNTALTSQKKQFLWVFCYGN